MRMVFSLVLVLGLALAGFAVYMARGILSQNAAALHDAQAKTKETVPVFIMNTAVKYGDVLKKEDVATISWPKAAVPEAAFTDFNKLFPADGEQRIVTRDIGKFEPILTSNVTEPGGDAGITSRLAPGMRAFAVKVDVASGVSGFLKPGDRVDVYWTGTNTQDHSDVTRLIEPGVSVVAVDQISNADQTAKAIIARTITVQATPQQVAVLAQGQATGKLAPVSYTHLRAHET